VHPQQPRAMQQIGGENLLAFASSAALTFAQRRYLGQGVHPMKNDANAATIRIRTFRSKAFNA